VSSLKNNCRDTRAIFGTCSCFDVTLALSLSYPALKSGEPRRTMTIRIDSKDDSSLQAYGRGFHRCARHREAIGALPASAANTERPRGSLKHVVSSHLPAAVIRGPPTHRRATKLLDDKFPAAVPSIRLPLTVASMGTTGTSKNGSLTTLA
jgi:hypothetical protein